MTRKLTEPGLVVATHNAGKLDEIRALLAPFGKAVTSAGELGLPEPVEDGQSFVDNARIKARAAVEATGQPCLADDSGICIDALDGAPGIHTADWAETPNGRDFKMAMQKTHDKLEEIAAPRPRTAQFRCTLVMAWPDGHDEVFEGVLPGQVVWPMRGAEGHGYDPIFQPDGFETTLGEISAEQKNTLSHRFLAFEKFIAGCLA